MKESVLRSFPALLRRHSSVICSYRGSVISARRMASSAFSVFVTCNDIPEEALKMLQEKCDVEKWPLPKPMPQAELLKKIVGRNALFCTLTNSIDTSLLDAAGPGLRVIGTMSVGFDHIDLPECKRRNILVGNTPDVLTDATAELAIALLLATARRLFEANAQITNGGWTTVLWSPLFMCGTTLKGSTVGIVGLGRIGTAVLERLKPFKVAKFLYSGNKPKPVAKDLGTEFVPVEELLQQADFVVVCCSLTPATKLMFDQKAFDMMKPSAIFINVSRGGIVNHDDLYDALVTRKIRAAGLDVMTPEPLPVEHPLTKLSNCVLLPHIGSATVETRTTMAVLTAQNILAGLEGRPLPAPL